MRNAILSIAALVGLAVTAATADARPHRYGWGRTYYRPAYSTYRYNYSPGYVYPASYYGGYGGYGGYYGSYYRPSGLTLSWSPGYGFNLGYGTGGYYGGYPWYGGYRRWGW